MNFNSLTREDSLRSAGLAGGPHSGDQFSPNSSPERQDSESLLEEYLRTFARHRGLIVLCAVVGAVLAVALDLHTLPIYRTRTSIDIRSLNGDFMDMRSVAPTGNGSSDEINTNLQTQIKLLQSDTLLDGVTARLLAEPHPATIERGDLLSKLARDLHVGGDERIPYAAMVDDAAKRVKVKPLGLTRLVEVTCDSWNAKFSAEFCNTLTSTFEEQDLQTRATEAQKTQAWLTKQVADVRQRAEDSQKKLEAAVGGNGLMLSQTTTTAGEDRLRSLQDELVKAQADRMQKEAEASLTNSAATDTLPEVQDDPTHRAYEARLADLRSQLSQLVPTLTEQNPKVIKLRAEIADAQAGLNATARASTTRQSNEYSAARHREQLIELAYKEQQAAVSSDLQKASQVSLLRREVDSEQQLYQTLLQRAKEAGFAAAMQAATIRVIDAARPPHFAASPRRTLGAGIGLVLGGMFGIGLSFYKDRNNKVFRVPGDVERFLHVRELGVIPATRRSTFAPAKFTSLLGDGPPRDAELGGPAIALTRWNDNFSLTAEAYRNTTLSILLADSSKRSRSYVVSSPNVGEGKTTVTSNLGVALSKAKLRVVLIDGDLRRPNLHNAFAVPNDFGLRDILRGEVDLETMPTELLTHRVGLPNIAMIPAGEGKEDVVELLHSPHFSTLLARLSRDFDVILIDSPPILHMADARILAGQSDGGILIFRAGVTSREQAASARDVLHHDGVLLVGTILNDFDPSAEGKGNYYSSYYRYGHEMNSSKVGTRA
jgi:succinoglycan biosynthesis transport protein ExoP